MQVGFCEAIRILKVSCALSLPSFISSLTTYIKDGMALVQFIYAKKGKTCGLLLKKYFPMNFYGAHSSTCF